MTTLAATAPLPTKRAQGGGAETASKPEAPTIPPLDAGSAEDAARKVFRRKPHATWTYRNAKGEPLFHVARFNDDDGGKEILPLCWTGNGWKSKAWPAPRPLYNLDKIALRPDATIIICEGEKAADAAALIFRDFVATTSSGGAQSAAKTDWAPLAKRRVIVWPDNDEAGLVYAREVAARLAELGCDVSIIDAAAFAAIDPKGGSRSTAERLGRRRRARRMAGPRRARRCSGGRGAAVS